MVRLPPAFHAERRDGRTCRRCAYGPARRAYCRRCSDTLDRGSTVPKDSRTAAHDRWESIPGPRHLTRPFVVKPLRVPEDAVPRELSAAYTVTPRQALVLRVAAGALVIGLVANAAATAIALVAVATALYAAATLFRVRTFTLALGKGSDIVVEQTEALAIWDRSLPMYTVLVPAFREPQVIGALIANLDRLDYPRDRLDIKLLLEDDDAETIRAAQAAVTGDHMELVRVPYSEPRTKPKALNVGLRLARGRRHGRGLVTIYDAEDRPDPLQLRRAVAAFRRAGTKTACIQAKLAYYNADQNMITRWFTAEYATWFSQLLPGLVRQGVPIPLGGTSNHFRRTVLEQVGGWDPHNVTEDADLGIRLHRAGYRTEVLDSTTFEEANSDFVNWVKQRSRWYKGYMQTWLVHMRNPVRLWRELGPSGFVGFNLFVGGTPLLALLNPVFWTLTLSWFLHSPAFIVALFPPWLYYASLASLVLGNFGFVYMAMLSAQMSHAPGLVLAATLSPVYWGMMSIAAIKAAIQLVQAPSFWEKTSHGLDRAAGEVPQRAET